MLQLLDINEFNNEKLLSSQAKHYKEILLILKELVELIQSKYSSTHRYNPKFMDDETFAYELINPNNNNNNHQSQAATAEHSQNEEANLNRRLQILDDPSFYHEYRNLIQYGSASLIPPNLLRIVKCLNENSDYLSEFDYTKSTRKEEVCLFIKSKLEQAAKEDLANGSIVDINDVIKVKVNCFFFVFK